MAAAELAPPPRRPVTVPAELGRQAAAPELPRAVPPYIPPRELWAATVDPGAAAALPRATTGRARRGQAGPGSAPGKGGPGPAAWPPPSSPWHPGPVRIPVRIPVRTWPPRIGRAREGGRL